MTATDSIPDTTGAELDAALQRANRAAEEMCAQPPAGRARQLRAAADALDAAAAELVDLARAESNLSEARLTGELARTTFQLRLFAETADSGEFLHVVLDRADPDFPLGPKPDLRRMLLPLGPVLVFAASNFPFAFSVAGGDTAAALAAGCPVLVKAHPGHPALSQRTAEIVGEALRSAGAPEGAFDVVFGFETGSNALQDPRIRAAAFTGSVPAGRALHDIAAARPDPIPFFGELGSLNPVFVTPGAVRARGADIASGYVNSYCGNAGQLCTKPGLLFLPAGHGLGEALVGHARDAAAHPMLNERLHEGFEQRRREATEVPGVQVLVDGDAAGPSPTLLAASVDTLLEHREALLAEAFGPLSIVVEYDSPQEANRVAEAFAGNLTATVHAEDDEAGLVGGLVRRLRERAGRVLFNGWPTGVAVSPAMQHGGPYPATTDARFTSVGTASIERFLRPVTYQNAPAGVLPEPLRDDNPWNIPQTVHQPG
ncbi:aldehyde dehydrogenase (NADP(+)) [Saccharopolyspora sp. HNM0983]|uniref:Aldehyde dehydrogenase (NADP(+)) n=1 Tax=Saccharopolyspora montiporae TaxID=2781240 RepID=A0A929G088_9PSEU|nr:aldehyde dehydrogenase (NADP(+)) [Saccharopolyspora sp. HNM0983]